MALVAMAAAPLWAQDVGIRVGAVHAHYADSLAGSAGAVTARASWTSARFRSVLDASFAQFTTGGWAAQLSGGLLGMHLFTPTFGVGMRVDGDGGLLRTGNWSGTASAGPFAALLAGDLVLSTGVTAGAVRRIDDTAHADLSAAVEVRYDAGPWSIAAGVTGTRAGPFRFADATAGLGLRAGRLAVGAVAGARTGSLGGKPWVQGYAEVAISRWATLEAVAGTFPEDLSGFTSGRYLSLGIWLGRGPRATAATPAATAWRRSAPGAVVVERVGSEQARATFDVPGATQVAIAGEWNQWKPDPLEPVGSGRWRAVLPLGQGAYRFSLVVDGARWIVPPGVPSLPDSFGGTVGLLIVED
jgi:hypothetical protein